jgi:two-component system LytT family sensor kinase
VHANDSKLILITLLIELGVAAAVASSLARSNRFQRLLLLKQRTTRETLPISALFGCPGLELSVDWVRQAV